MAGKISLEEIISRFNSLDIKVRIGIFVALLVMVLAIDYLAIMQFQLKAITEASAQIKKTDEEIGKLEADESRMGQIKNSLKKAREDFNKLREKVRPLQDLPLVVEDLAKMAAAAHLSVDQINPQREGQEDFATIGGVKFYAMPVEITAHTGFHHFGLFLNAVENSNVMFLLKDLKMEGSDHQNGMVAVRMVIKVIVAEKPLEAAK